jgi:ankyrin repeat protein
MENDLILKLFKMLKNNDFKNVINILKNNDNIDINYKDDNGLYLIDYAILYNNIKIIKELLNKNQKLDYISSEGRSILYVPIKYKYNEMVKLLIDSNNIGISLLNIIDSYQDVPINYTIYFNNFEIFKLLLKKKCNLNILDNNNNDILSLLLNKNIEDKYMIELFNYNIILNNSNNQGDSSLHLCVIHNRINIIKLLIDKNPNINIVNNITSGTPFMYSIIYNNYDIFNILLDHKPDLYILDRFSNNCLHLCVLDNNYKMFNKLLKYYDNYNFTNANSMTILHLIFSSDIKNINNYDIEYLILKTNLNI